MRRLLLALAVGTALAATTLACARVSPDPTPDPTTPGPTTAGPIGDPVPCGMSPCGPPPIAWPAGRTFVGTSVFEYDAPKALVPDTAVYLDIPREGWHLLARAGCNTFSFHFHFVDDRLYVGEVASTLVGCPDDRAAQDAWLSDFFRDSPRWTFEGHELTLRTDTAEIRTTEMPNTSPSPGMVP